MTITPGIGATENIGELAGALAKAQTEFKPVMKDTDNPYYNSKYADLSSVINATQQALAKNGLVVIQNPVVDCEGEKAGVKTIIAHSSGQWMSHDLMLPATMKGKEGTPRFDAQSVGSAITYARRYSYQAIVGIAAEADDDGNAAVAGQNGSVKAAQAVAQRKIAEHKSVTQQPMPKGQESITVSPWENGTLALAGHGLTILAANHEGGISSFATWLKEAKLWIITAEDLPKIENLSKLHNVSLIKKDFPEAADDEGPEPGEDRSGNEPVGPVISAIATKAKKNGGQYLSVRWGDEWFSCFDEKLFPYLGKAKDMSAGLLLSEKNTKGYKNIIGIMYIGRQNFHQNSPVS